MYALFRIELKKRQCLFSTLTMELIWPKRDLVHIEVPLKIAELTEGATSPVPLEFYICRKRNMKATFAQFAHLKNFVGPVQATHLKQQDQLVVLAESEDAANHMIDAQVGEVLSRLGEHVQDIHFTD